MKKTLFVLIVLVSFLALPAFAATPVKIAVAASDKTPAAAVSEQAGQAPYFLFFDGKGKLLEAVENPVKNSESPGPSMVNYLASKGAKVVVAGGFGPRILEIMKTKGITPFPFKGAAKDAVKKFLESK